MKFRVSDLLIFILLFIFVSAFPVELFNISLFWQLIIRIGLRVLILAYYIYICIRNRINIFKFYNLKRIILFLPFFLACCSNLIAAGIDGAYTGITTYTIDILSLMIIYHLLGAIVEEFLFRLFIQNALVNASSLKRIIFSAAIFALFHLLNIVNISSVDGLITVLIQVAYNFGLGILLAFVYEYTYSLPASIVLHFTFNLLNTVIYQYLGCNLFTTDFTFYITAVAIATVLAVYIALIYLFVLKRNNRYFRE